MSFEYADITKTYKDLLDLCRYNDIRESFSYISVINFIDGSKIYFDNGLPVSIKMNHLDYIIDVKSSPCCRSEINKEDIPSLVLPPPALKETKDYEKNLEIATLDKL